MTEITPLSDGTYKIKDGLYTYLTQPNKAFVQLCLGAKILATNHDTEDELEVFHEAGWRDFEITQGYKNTWVDALGLTRVEPLYLATIRQRFGLTATEMAEALGVNVRTLRSWESGREPIPYRISRDLHILQHAHDALVARYTASQHVRLPYDKTDPYYSQYPRTWFIGALARALDRNPNLQVSWA